MSACLLHIYLVAVVQNRQCVEYSQDKLELSFSGVMVMCKNCHIIWTELDVVTDFL